MEDIYKNAKIPEKIFYEIEESFQPELKKFINKSKYEKRRRIKEIKKQFEKKHNEEDG